MLEYFFRIALFDDTAVIDKQQAVADLTGKPHLMGDDDHRHAFLCQLAHDIKDLADHLRVKRGRRFIKQHDLGLHGQCAGNGYTLLLSAGKLIGIRIGLIRQANAGQELLAVSSASSFLM